MKKRILSLLLTLVMLVGMIPMTSLPAFAAAEGEVYVGGVGMNDGDYLAVGATTTQTTKPSGGYAYFKDDTLILNDYEYEGKGYRWDYGGYYACIYGPTSLNIVLNGSSRIAQTDGDICDCIYSLGDVVVSGTGSLTLTDGYSGIYTESNVTINGGTITVQDVSVGIITHDNVTVNGGAIHVTSEENSLIGSAGITINGGELTLVSTNTVKDSTYYAMYSDSITIADGLEVQASTDPDGTLVDYVAADNNTYDRVEIKLPPIWVGGVKMYDGDYLAVGATATQTTKPSGGYAYYENGKLTLNNYSYKGYGYDGRGSRPIIYAPNDIQIELVGNNNLTHKSNWNTACITVTANVSLTGEGTLNLQNATWGIDGSLNISIESGSLNIDNCDLGIYSFAGKVIINGGNFEVNAIDCAVNGSKGIEINGGNGTFRNMQEDVYSVLHSRNGTVTINPSLIVMASTTADGELGEYVAENHASYEKIVITPPDIYVGGVCMGDGDYLAVGATTTQTTKPSSGYAYYKNGKLTLNNYSYEGKGYQYDSGGGYYATVFAKYDLTLELIGNNTLTQTEFDSDMIYVYGANLTVGGDGKLTGTPGGYALYADKDITINGGTIAVSSRFESIISFNGDVIINGGDIIAESDGRSAICANRDVTINGGNVTATSNNPAAISCGYYYNFTVAAGMKIQASTTVDGELGEYVAANHDSYKKIVIKPAASNITVNCLGDIDYTVSGKTVTVNHEVICKVGYLSGEKYEYITAVKNADGTYSYTAPDSVTEVILFVNGDVNNNGAIDSTDYMRIKGHFLGTYTLEGAALVAGDVNNNSAIDSTDYMRIKGHFLGTYTIEG